LPLIGNGRLASSDFTALPLAGLFGAPSMNAACRVAAPIIVTRQNRSTATG
jgi:hypothetical protein